MKVLLASPCISEFGWELMSWQGYVRRQSRKYECTLVCSSRAHEFLYADFADQFIPHDIQGLRDCYILRGVTTPREKKRTEALVRDMLEQLRAEGHILTTIQHQRFIPIAEQEFIPYGTVTLPAYDIIVHARNKQSRDPYYRKYNWSQDNWDKLCARLLKAGFRVGAVGLSTAARLPKDVDDLRDTPLKELTNIIATARVVAGPSSGPMHLASLCKTPHVVWTGRKHSTTINGTNRLRYERKWNPFQTKCYVYDVTPNPTVDVVFALLKQALEENT